MGKGGITRSLLFRLGCALFLSSLARKYIFCVKWWFFKKNWKKRDFLWFYKTRCV